MTTIIQLSEESIYTDLEVDNKEDALKILTDSMTEQGFVHPDYYESIKQRENEAPTGLDSSNMGFAIPHTEPKYVKKDSLGVAVLKNTVPFTDMLTKEANVDVKVIFLLALSENTKHLNILKQIMTLVNEEEMLEKIIDMPKATLIDYLQTHLITE